MSDSLATVVLLGLVEGLTEFIPVSSTGHLILAGQLLGFKGEASKTFDIVIQLGAILAVLVAYWRLFADVLLGLARRDAPSIAFTRNVLLGFLPSAIVGLLFYKAVKTMMETPIVVALALIVGGIAILAIERLLLKPRVVSVAAMPASTALSVGLAQCLSLIPGVSRSGATIMGALSMGVDRKTAAEFSFFLAVPTMIAASGYELFKARHALDAGNSADITLGFVISFMVALMVIKSFVAIVSRFGFAPFAWYRIVVGTTALIWLTI